MPSKPTTCSARGRYVVSGATLQVRGMEQRNGLTWSLMRLTIANFPAYRPPAWAMIDLTTALPGARPAVADVRELASQLRDPQRHLSLDAGAPLAHSLLGYAHALLMVREIPATAANHLLHGLLARRGLNDFTRSEGLALLALEDWRCLQGTGSVITW